MIAPIEIVKAIQKVSPMSSKIRFFVSLADYAFKYGGLTTNQETAFKQAIEELKKEGNWDETID